MFLTKLIIEYLLKNPDSSYEDLIVSIAESEGDVTEESVILFSPFIVEQIKSFDSAAEEDENLLSETPAFKTLVRLSGMSGRSNACTEPKTNTSHVRPIARTDARRAANSDSLTCSTSLVTHFFDSIFKEVIECEANNSRNINGIKEGRLPSQIFSNEMNKKIHWIGTTVYEDRFARTSYYTSVKINELTVRINI